MQMSRCFLADFPGSGINEQFPMEEKLSFLCFLCVQQTASFERLTPRLALFCPPPTVRPSFQLFSFFFSTYIKTSFLLLLSLSLSFFLSLSLSPALLLLLHTCQFGKKKTSLLLSLSFSSSPFVEHRFFILIPVQFVRLELLISYSQRHFLAN
jgi:hypothetical protein